MDAMTALRPRITLLALAVAGVPGLLALAADEEASPLKPAGDSRYARKYREQAEPLWEKAKAVVEQARTREPPTVEEMRAAMGEMEQAAPLYEKALHEFWSKEDNESLAALVKGWYELRGKLPAPPEPQTAEERKEFDERLDKERKERVRDARKFLLEVLKARKYREQFERCGRCEGRGVLLGGFGDRQVCPSCDGRRMRVDPAAVMAAWWLPLSPLHRADSRHAMRFERLVRSAERDPQKLAPFIYSASVDGEPEDHDVWIRFQIEEKIQPQADGGKVEKRDSSYVVYRVGDVWWLREDAADRDLFELPEEETPEGD